MYSIYLVIFFFPTDQFFIVLSLVYMVSEPFRLLGLQAAMSVALFRWS